MNTDKKLCINCKYYYHSDGYTPERCYYPNNLDYVSNSPFLYPKSLRDDILGDKGCRTEGRWFEEKVIVEMPKTKKSWFRKLLEGI